MEEQSRRRLSWLLGSLVGIAYFLVASQPLPRVLSLEPVWADSVEPDLAPSKPSSEPPLPFVMEGRYGYLDPSRGILLSAPKPYGIAISEDGYVAYERLPSSLAWKDPGGASRFVSEGGAYPFIAGSRRFLLGPDQATVSELGADGRVLWKRVFPSLLTAFDASPSLALFGTLDGRLFGIDPAGSLLLDFAPGGSRIEGIYGCAVSPDGLSIAAIAGLDAQRLVVLERREEAYRVTYHRWLDSDFRRPVSVNFTDGGRELVFESPGGLGIYSVEGRHETFLELDNAVSEGLSLDEPRLLLFLQSSSRSRLVVASPGGERLFAYPFASGESMIRARGSSVFLGLRSAGGPAIVRMDFGEE
jgi:hypothetical protein